MIPLPVPTPPAAIAGAEVGAESGQHSLARASNLVDIAPGESVIAIKLDNPRNVSVTLSLDDPVPTSGGGNITCEVTQNGAGEALIAIHGAALRDELRLTLRMWASDREYDPYTFTVRCREYTVSFDNQGYGGTAAADQSVPLFGLVSDPGNLTETGWFFGGWFKEAEGTTPWDFATDTVTGDTTLYAKWGITLSGTVSIDGTPRWNQPLTANIISITPSASASDYTYQWKRDGADISGANSQTYTLTAADEAAIISVEVSRTGYASSITGAIAAAVDSIGGTGEAGGIIFYYNTGHTYGTWNYLEAARKDIESPPGTRATRAWASTGLDSTDISGTLTDIGTGAANTAAILAPAADPNAPAAKACVDYRAPAPYATFGDWFLPSKDELNAMWTSGITAASANGFDTVSTNTCYWSSSQFNGTYVWRQKSNDGTQNNNPKSFTFYVRAVRAF